MKRLQKQTAIMLALAIAFTIISAGQVKAATDSFPTKFRVDTWVGYEDSIDIKLNDHHMYIANVKSKSKDLVVGLTDYDYSSSRQDSDTYTLGFLPKKHGTYDITYDVMKDSKKVKTIKTKVYAYPKPIDVQLEGVEGINYGKKTSAKLKVTSQKGNTITKIEVGTYKIVRDNFNDSKRYENIDSEIEYKIVNNNSMIQLGTQPYYFKTVADGGDDNYYESFCIDPTSRTFIRVTYKDKYTKQNEQVVYTYMGFVE